MNIIEYNSIKAFDKETNTWNYIPGIGVSTEFIFSDNNELAFEKASLVIFDDKHKFYKWQKDFYALQKAKQIIRSMSMIEKEALYSLLGETINEKITNSP
jgi:hypothetical protein